MAKAHITRRAGRNIDAIEEYSIRKWGERRAARYIDDIDKTLELLAGQPGLMQSKPEVSDQIKFYVSGKHILVLGQINGNVYLLTVMHFKMAWRQRVKEMHPTLMREMEQMHVEVTRLPR